jgi:hypothetical protein
MDLMAEIIATSSWSGKSPGFNLISAALECKRITEY